MKFYYINKDKYKGILNSEIYQLILKSNSKLAGNFTEEITFENSLSNYLKLESDESFNTRESNSRLANNNSGTVEVWTDGGSRNTGNIKGDHIHAEDEAAWAYKISYQGKEYTDTNAEKGATNNKMELLALNMALVKLLQLGINTNSIVVYSDSMYVINTVTKWMKGWKATNWKRKGKYPIKNIEIIKDIDDCLADFPNFKMKWVKGHTELSDKGHAGNNQVDNLLNKSMDSDSGYTSSYESSNSSSNQKATPKQIKYIKHLDSNSTGLDTMTKKEASMLIRELLNE